MSSLWFNFHQIPALYADIPAFYSKLFSAIYHHMLPCVWCTDEGGGGVAWGAKNCSQVCANDYSGAQVNVPTQSPMPDPSPDPGLAGYW